MEALQHENCPRAVPGVPSRLTMRHVPHATSPVTSLAALEASLGSGPPADDLLVSSAVQTAVPADRSNSRFVRLLQGQLGPELLGLPHAAASKLRSETCNSKEPHGAFGA